MSEKNITDLSEIENINISEEDLPDVISEQFEAIVDIDKRIVEAENRCATAKETADKMILAKALNQKDAINASVPRAIVNLPMPTKFKRNTT